MLAERINTISVKIPKDLDKILALVAKKEDRSKSAVIRRALQEYLEDQEDLQIGLEALAKYKANPEATITLEELMKKHGL
jgi:RHH-type rel operon transcriptional repressor/antitoxin RelB